MGTKRNAATAADVQAAAEDATDYIQPEAVPQRVVVVTLDDVGGYRVHTQGVDVLSAPTLLRLAARQVEAQLGLE